MSKIENLAKNRNFRQNGNLENRKFYSKNIKVWSKIEILAKNRNFVENPNLGQKSKIRPKTRFYHFLKTILNSGRRSYSVDFGEDWSKVQADKLTNNDSASHDIAVHDIVHEVRPELKYW